MRHEVTMRRVLYEIPGMRAVEGTDAEFAGSDGLMLPMRIYMPPAPPKARVAVVIVEGYPDGGFAKRLGCRFMDMEWSVSLAQLIAASGLAAITHSNRVPAEDALALMRHLTLDGWRLGVWATSGHAPTGMIAIEQAACGVLVNPILGPTAVTKPLFLVRSGQDETPGLNSALDAFVVSALVRNLPMTLVNHADAPHSFDLFHDSEQTRLILRQALSFLRTHLGVAVL